MESAFIIDFTALKRNVDIRHFFVKCPVLPVRICTIFRFFLLFVHYRSNTEAFFANNIILTETDAKKFNNCFPSAQML